MRSATFRNFEVPRKSSGKLPVAQDTDPNDHAFTSLTRGHHRTDEDVPRADVAVENSALDNGKLVACQCITTIVSQRWKGAQRRKGSPVMQYQITCATCLLDLISEDGRQTSATTVR